MAAMLTSSLPLVITGAPQVVDTTGAGDTFTAAFAVALLAGQTDGDALLFAGADSSS